MLCRFHDYSTSIPDSLEMGGDDALEGSFGPLSSTKSSSSSLLWSSSTSLPPSPWSSPLAGLTATISSEYESSSGSSSAAYSSLADIRAERLSPGMMARPRSSSPSANSGSPRRRLDDVGASSSTCCQPPSSPCNYLFCAIGIINLSGRSPCSRAPPFSHRSEIRSLLNPLFCPLDSLLISQFSPLWTISSPLPLFL